jgi:hypothetical protein
MTSPTAYLPAADRYATMTYRRCGRSGLKLPAVSLGLWHNFGGVDTFENARGIVRSAFDLGITHFDLAAPSTWASRISTWPTTTVRRRARRKRTSAGCCAATSRRTATSW